jgi:hypothetical protein
MDKNINTLVKDIYKLMETKEVPKGVDADKAIDDFGEAIKKLMKKEFSEYKRDGRRLRLSNVGRDDRYLWNVWHGTEQEKIEPHTYIKFMYGHLIEEMLLCLTKLSGHTVTDEQKQCEVAGIRGSMDCRIDGIVTDVKSTSTFGFKKFKEGTLAKDDPFGYIAQIKAYAHSEGETKYGWLAMDKQNGHLTYLMYDEEDFGSPMYEYINWSIEERIENIKKIVELPEAPQFCTEYLEDGKSGNLKLSTTCSYCPFKKQCHPQLRTFIYSSGPRYLVKVVNTPKVPEVGSNGDF